MEWGGGSARLLLWFAGYKRAAALAGQAADFENSKGVSSGRVYVQGCCGVHGFCLALWWKSEENINRQLINVNRRLQSIKGDAEFFVMPNCLDFSKIMK